MKEQKKRGRISSLLVMLLVGLMGAGSACTGFLSLPKNGLPSTTTSSQQSYILEHQTGVDASKYFNQDLALDSDLAGDILSDDDDIHLIISTGDSSLFDLYDSGDKSMSYQDFLSTRTARVNAENMRTRQQQIFKQISKKVNAEFVTSFTGLTNGFSIKIKYGDRKLADQAGFRAGMLESRISEVYAIPQVEDSDGSIVADNSIDCEETGIFINDSEYQGQGMLVAVLDSGLDYLHPSFSTSNLPKDTNGDLDLDALRITKQDLIDMWDTHSFSAENYLLGSKNLTVNDVFMSEKVPFAYDYGDWDIDVNTPEDGMHGTHVSGIIVGQTPDEEILYNYIGGIYNYECSYDGHLTQSATVPTECELYTTQKNDSSISATEKERHRKATLIKRDHVSGGEIELDKNGNPKKYIKDKQHPDSIRTDDFGRDMIAIRGVAPLAQIVGMKVFSDFNSGAQEDSILSALEDAAALGVDVINMSLGTASGFSDMSDQPRTQETYEKIHALGINLVVAAGNNASSATGGSFGTNLTSNPDSGMIGSPGSLDQAIAVASIQGVKSKYISAKDLQGKELGASYFTEAGKTNGDKYDFVKELIAAVKGVNFAGISYENETITVNGQTHKYYEVDPVRGEVLRIPYVIIPGVGTKNDFSGRNVRGKIALISRGDLTFTEKINNARAAGAIGAVIYNNVAGTISMAIDEANEPSRHMPACSVTMDSSQVYKTVNNAYFEINAKQEAGPFMSDFSSWGPLPNLQLKPEITGHGGEIYSASPGNNYARISGTSMACPNVAGLTVAMRQYLNSPQGVAKYGNLSKSELQSLIYKLMMSTATAPKNEFNKPYSPRKAGAGIANLKHMLATDAYIYVEDIQKNYIYEDGVRTSKFNAVNNGIKEYTKIELLDDPDKSGEYEMEFFVKNTSGSPLTYKPEVSVLTETVSSDRTYKYNEKGELVVDFEGTVAEKSYELSPSSKQFSTVIGGVETPITDEITVPANQTLQVRLKIVLSGADKTYLDTYFANGMYVEGFITLVDKNEQEDKINLNVPYLAFYGDWTEAPMLSYSIYEVDPDDKDSNIFEKDKRRTQSDPLMAFGKFTQNGVDYTYPLGSYLWVHSDIFKDVLPEASEEKTSMSLSPESIYELYFLAGLQRPFKSFFYKIIDASTGEVIESGERPNARKSGVKIELSPLAMGCKNGGTYRFEMEGYLDYLDGKQGNNNKWGFNFTINTNPPIITNCEIVYEKRTSGDYGFNRYLDFYITSDHYLSAMSLSIWDNKTETFENIYDKGLRPIYESAFNGTTRVRYTLDEFDWNHLKDNGFLIQTEIFDWAANSSFYRIDLTELKTAADEVHLADIGLYEEYTSSSNEKIQVLTNYIKDIVYDNNGNFKSFEPEEGYQYIGSTITNPKTVYMLPNRNVELKYAVVATNNFWEEDLLWESEDESVVSINHKTGEIYARKAGQSRITLRSKATNKTAAILVEVLSPETCQEFGIKFYQETLDGSFVTPQGRIPSSVRFTEDILNYYNSTNFFYPIKTGERFEIEAEFDPWFTKENFLIDGRQLTDEEWAERITWTASDTRAFVIDQGVNKYGLKVDNDDPTKKVSPFAATIIAARGTLDADGRYTPPGGVGSAVAIRVSIDIGVNSPVYITQTFYAGLIPEFVVENGVFTEYHGDNQDYMPNIIKENIRDRRNYSGTKEEIDSKIIENYQNIITNSDYDMYNSFANNKGKEDLSLFPYDPKSWPQIEYIKSDEKWMNIQLVHEDGTPLSDGEMVDDIFRYKKLFAGIDLRLFIDGSRIVEADGTIRIDSKYDLPTFKYRTYYQGAVKIPTDLHIVFVGPRVFTSNQHITKLEFTEGIQRIQTAACAEMPALREVILPSTIKVLEEWSFAGKKDPVEGYFTSLHIFDTSRVIEPIAYSYAAVQNQPLIGVRNLVAKGEHYYVDNGGVERYHVDESTIPFEYFMYSHDTGADGYLLKDAEGNPRYFEKVFDLSMARSISQQAFYDLQNVKYIDLANVTVMNRIAFVYYGYNVGAQVKKEGSDYAHKVELITGPKTAMQEVAFYLNGINQPLTINNKRVPVNAFAVSLYLPKLIFTSDELIIGDEAFLVAPRVTEIDFQGTVESIGKGAFEASILTNAAQEEISVSSLRTIKWSSVKRIEERAFYDLVGITELRLPDGLEYMGKDAFGISDLPHQEWQAFTNFLVNPLGDGINKIIIPETFNSEPTFVLPFTQAVNFDTIEVEGNNEKYEVGNGMLLKKSGSEVEIALVPYGLTNPVLPATVTKIGAYAFAGNVNITSIDLQSITNLVIEEGAFMACEKLTSVKLPNSVTEIPDYLFADSTKLTSITWNQNDVTKIGNYAFKNTGITSAISTPNLVELGNYAFSESRISSFDFQAATSLGSIPEGAFSGCSYMISEVELPSNIKEIKSLAFSRSGISAVKGDQVKSIGVAAFQGASRLKKAYFPSAELIKNSAFNSYALTSVDISKVKEIEGYAFYGQSQLTKFVNNVNGNEVGLSSLTDIGSYAFANTAIQSFEKSFPSVKNVGSFAFANNTGLKIVTIHDKVETMGTAPFAKAKNIVEFKTVNNKNFVAIDGVLFKNVQDGIVVIYNEGGTASGITAGEDALELIQYPAGNYRQWTQNGQTMTDRSRIYNVPNKTVKIAAHAFYGSKYLTTVKFPDTLKNIGDGAFFDTTVTSYTFTSLRAPVLESWMSGISATDSGDDLGHYWGVYSNFVGYFNVTEELFIYEENLSEEDTFIEEERVLIGADETRYMYSTVTSNRYNDQFALINSSINGGGFTGTDFGLTIEYPSNGLGYDSFVFANYFTNKKLGTAIITQQTIDVINLIESIANYNEATLNALLNQLTAAKNALRTAETELAEAQAALKEAQQSSKPQNIIDDAKAAVTQAESKKKTAEDNLRAAQNNADIVPNAQKAYNELSTAQRVHVYNYNKLEAVVTLYLKVFKGTVYSVSYINGTELFDRVVVDSGVKTNKPANTPQKEWHNFVGWYLGDELYDFSKTVTKDLVLFARFEHSGQEFTISFEDADTKDIQVLAGTSAVKPNDPAQKNREFKGWYIGEEEFDFATPITQDITLTAKWEDSDRSCGGCGTITFDSFNAATLTILLSIIAIAFVSGYMVLKKRKAN